MKTKMKCCLVLNQSSSSEPKTVVVLGTPAGGTSSVAGLLRKIGVFMGDEVTPANHEDQYLQGVRGPLLSQRISERNADHDLWGWKDPVAIDHIEDFADELRNPHFVVVFRDLFATAASELFRRYRDRGEHEHYLETVQFNPIVDPDSIAEFRRQMDSAFERQKRLYTFVSQCHYPMLLVSYERLLNAPIVFARDAAKFLQIEVENDCLEQAAAYVAVDWEKNFKKGRPRQ